MIDMKCPFCQQELLLSSYRDDDEDHQMWNCLSCQLCAQRKLWQELIHTHKALEQSEICCSDWEKQALDYKAENIALLIKLEFIVDVLKEIDKLLSSNKFDVRELPLLNLTQTKISMLLNFINIKQLTAPEQKGE